VAEDKYSSSEEVHALAGAEEIGAGRALLRMATAKRDITRREMEENPRLDSEDCKYDVRFQLGVIAAMNWLVKQPKEARDYIDRLPDRVE